MGIKWERQMKLGNLRDILTDLISRKLCPQKKQIWNYTWRGRHTWTDLGEVCRCLILHVEFKANLCEGSVQFHYLLHCSFHFLTPLGFLFPGKIGNRRTKIPIIRKDFLAVFAVLLELGRNNNKNLTNKANLTKAPEQLTKNLMQRYLNFWASKVSPLFISIPAIYIQPLFPNKLGN